MFRIREGETYRNYPGFLLMIALFSLINVILIAVRINSSFYGGAFIPMIAMFYAKYYLTGIFRTVAFAGLVCFFILVLAGCWWGARNNYRWLSRGMLIYLLDTVFMMYYIFVTGFKPLWLMDIAFHLILLAILWRGVYIGRAEEKQAIPQAEPAEEVPADADEK
ncbi:MAG: hypothetical protein IJI05_00500 [Erysipelotrichaceae bacterium]|nr:hypothetical protein [Erysipelotrichaceae bacterium]